MLFNNIKVAGKLLMIVAVAAVAMLVISFSGYRALNSADEGMQSMYQKEMQGVQHLGTAVEYSRVMMVKTLQIITAQDVSQDRLNTWKKQQQDGVNSVEKALAEYKDAVKGTPAEDTAEIDKQWANYKKVMGHAIDLASQGKGKEAMEYYESAGSPATRGLRDALHGMQDVVNAQAEAAAQANSDNNSSAAMMIIVVTIVAIAIQGIFSVFTANNITSALSAMVHICEKLRDGDFRGSSHAMDRGDEFGHLSKVLSEMQHNMASYMKGVYKAIQDINDSSGNLKEASMQSAQASVQSAEAVGDAAHLVMDQENMLKDSQELLTKVNDSIQAMRGHANEVSNNSMTAAGEAAQGNKALEKSVREIRDVESTVSSTAEMVTRLGSRSEEIGAIVDTISQIASQTNLLALNAAIEAARAGEQGRGFAVVAEEVRKLAEESQNAAQQITALIKGIQDNTDAAVASMEKGSNAVREGSASVEKLRETFQAINAASNGVVERAQNMIEELHAVSEDTKNINEKSVRIAGKGDEVSQEMESVSAASEEQSASATEIADASQSLATLAQELQTSLQKFRF